jgi:hypothetical protein
LFVDNKCKKGRFVSPDPFDDELMADFELEYSNGKWRYIDESEIIQHKHSEIIE